MSDVTELEERILAMRAVIIADCEAIEALRDTVKQLHLELDEKDVTIDILRGER